MSVGEGGGGVDLPVSLGNKKVVVVVRIQQVVECGCPVKERVESR